MPTKKTVTKKPAKKISKAQYKKCAKVVSAYAKQQTKHHTKRAAKHTKKAAKSGLAKIKTWLKKK